MIKRYSPSLLNILSLVNMKTFLPLEPTVYDVDGK